MRSRTLSIALIVLGLLSVQACCQETDGSAPLVPVTMSEPELCPPVPGPLPPADPEPVQSPPNLLPAPPPDMEIPPNTDTVVTPGPRPSSEPLSTGAMAAERDPAPPALAGPISLNTALEIAFRHSPQIEEALAGVQVGRGGIREARARFNPTFNVEASHVFQGPTTTFELPSEDGGGGGSIDLVPDQTTTATLFFALPLDISNRLGYGTDLAEYGMQIDYLTMLTTSQQVIFRVKTAYYELLRACGQQTVAQAAVDTATTRLSNTEARYRAGTVARFDVTAAQTELANLTQQLISAQSRVYIAQSLLNQTMGVDVTYPTQVLPLAPDPTVTSVDVQQAVQTGLARRPELKSAQLGVTMNQTVARLERAALRPSLAVTGAANYNPDPTGFAGEKLTWQAGLTVSMPIWDGGVARARVDQAQAEAAASRSRVDQTELLVAQEVRIAALNVQESAQRTQTAAQAVDLAQEALRLANVRYEAGEAVAVEVTVAEQQLTEAQFNEINAQFDYALALAELERAQGAQPELASLQLLAGAGEPGAAEVPITAEDESAGPAEDQ